MGRYIDEILQPGEKVLYSTNAHWIFYWQAILAWIVALALLIASRMTTVDGLTLACLAAAAVVAVAALLLDRWRPGSTAGPPRPTSPISAWCTRPGSSSGAPSR